MDIVGDLTRNFSLDEFACNCGCNTPIKVSFEFIALLQQARDIAQTSFYITSGYRCEKRNKEAGGVSDSAHNKLPLACCDIECVNSIPRYFILKSLLSVFDRVGIGEDFIHVDSDSTKSPNVIWTYYA